MPKFVGPRLDCAAERLISSAIDYYNEDAIAAAASAQFAELASHHYPYDGIYCISPAQRNFHPIRPGPRLARSAVSFVANTPKKPLIVAAPKRRAGQPASGCAAPTNRLLPSAAHWPYASWGFTRLEPFKRSFRPCRLNRS